MAEGVLPLSRSILARGPVGVVHTPVRSRALPSMVFMVRKMSALLQVDRAGESESRMSDTPRELFLWGNKEDTSGGNGRRRHERVGAAGVRPARPSLTMENAIVQMLLLPERGAR